MWETSDTSQIVTLDANKQTIDGSGGWIDMVEEVGVESERLDSHHPRLLLFLGYNRNWIDVAKRRWMSNEHASICLDCNLDSSTQTSSSGREGHLNIWMHFLFTASGTFSSRSLYQRRTVLNRLKIIFHCMQSAKHIPLKVLCKRWNKSQSQTDDSTTPSEIPSLSCARLSTETNKFYSSTN